jgi:hypothetical protein
VVPIARCTSPAQVLRLVQVATMGAFVAAAGAELNAALAKRPATLLDAFASPADALHPFLPVFLGVLLMPFCVAAIAFALSRVYRVPGRAAAPFALFAVAIFGAVPIHGATLLLAMPFGGVVCGAGVLLSLLAWATGYRQVLGIPGGDGAQCIGLTVLAALAALPMLGALLATLA